MKIRSLGKPTQTAVDRFGVKPTNQASVLSSVVPVLPAAGQPICAPVPVPLVMFCSRIFVASWVTPSLNALWRAGLPQLLTRPSAKRTCVIALGLLRQPPEAIVAYALAISSGETLFSRPPSTSLG